MLPLALLCIIYYAEVRRLRLVLKDFLFLMQRRPFAFDDVSFAYFELLGEWDDVQARLGPISSFMTAAFFVKVANTPHTAVRTVSREKGRGREGVMAAPLIVGAHCGEAHRRTSLFACRLPLPTTTAAGQVFEVVMVFLYGGRSHIYATDANADEMDDKDPDYLSPAQVPSKGNTCLPYRLDPKG